MIYKTTCKVCSTQLPVDQPKHRGRKCYECYKAYYRDWRKRNRKKQNASHYRWAENNKEKAYEVVKRWREKHKEHYNEYHKIYQRNLKIKKLEDAKKLERDNNSQVEGNQPSSN